MAPAQIDIWQEFLQESRFKIFNSIFPLDYNEDIAIIFLKIKMAMPS